MSDDTSTPAWEPRSPLWVAVTITYDVRILQERERRWRANQKVLRP